MTAGWDLRLAGAAIGCWLATLAALHYDVGWWLGLGAAAVALVLNRWAAGRIAAATLVGVAIGAAVTAAQVAVRDAPAMAEWTRGHVLVTATIVARDDPRPVAGGTVLLPAETVAVTDSSGVRVKGSVRIVVLARDRTWLAVLPGQRISVVGRLGPSRGGDLTAAILSASDPPTLLGRPSMWQRSAAVLRAGLQRACQTVGGEAGGLVPGLVVGDVSAISPAVTDDFKTTGMTHLLAVSGSNIAYVVGIALALARWARAGPRTAVGVAALVLLGFVILVRPSPSVLRAATMGAIALLSLASGRAKAAVPALSATIICVLCWDPALAADPGFTLSTLATGGLVFLAPGWRVALARWLPGGLADAIAVPAAAQVACLPVIAALSGTVSLVAIPANLFAIPAVAPATAFGVAAALVSPIWPAAANLLAWCACWPARWLIALAHGGAKLGAASLAWPAGGTGGVLLALLLAAALVIGYSPLRRLRLGIAVFASAIAIGAVPVRVLADGWPPAGWIAVACDVGQGDAIVLAAGAGAAVVIDTGPEPTAVDGCLRHLGVEVVPLLVISHFHQDHIGGLAGVLRGRTVGVIMVPSFDEPALGYQAVLAAARQRGIAVRVGAELPRWQYGAVAGEVIGPVGVLTGTRSDPNNNSLEIRAIVGGVTILLLGDAETEEQQALLASLGAGALRAAILKVAHHGSAYQDWALLDAVHPAVALVSVGVGNSYGHPSLAVLAELARQGARVLRTDQQGDLAVVMTRNGLAVAVGGSMGGRR